MAEPVLRDPDPPELVRHRGPQPVRAANPKAPSSTAPAAGATEPILPPTPDIDPLSATPGAAIVDPARQLPPPPGSGTEFPPSAIPLEAARASSASATTRVTDTRADAIPPMPVRPRKSRAASQDTLEELRKRLDDLRERVARQTTAAGTSLKGELGEDADYVKIRARYYHQHRPIQVLSAVAAGGFLLGLFLGLWRH